jgi:RNA polymerase sigma-70 factor (ECF subfamily)
MRGQKSPEIPWEQVFPMAPPNMSQAEDNDAFLELLAQPGSQLFAYIYALVQNLHDADDLFQKTSVVLWKKFDGFEPGSDFMAWACRTAKFEVCNYVRTRRRDRCLFSDALLEQLAVSQRDRSGHLRQRRTALEKCLDKLSEKDRRMVDLCYFGEGNIKQAAAQLERPVGSVYDSLSRVRRALRECVQQTLAAEGH